MNKIEFVIIALLLLSQQATSQVGRPFLGAEQQIESYLSQKYSKNYIVSVTPFDTLLVTVQDALRDDEFLDPYGTLQHKMFFEAWEVTNDNISVAGAKVILGFSSGGTVLWESGPLCSSEGVSILGSSDLNRDGEVEILVSIRDSEEGKDYLSHLWIFSWNGARARIINDVDTQTGQSTLLSGDGWYEVFDWEGDGIMEIRAFWGKDYPFFPNILTSTRPMVTFSYNGSLYGLWPSTVQVPGNVELAHNRLSVKGTSSVVRSGLQFEYTYQWSNDTLSAQKIQRIFLVGADQSATSIAPPRWQFWLPSQPLLGVIWHLEDSQKKFMIHKGESATFVLRDTCLPAIVKYHIRGYAPSSTIWEGDVIRTQDEVRRDIESNSISGFTIAPKPPPSPFVPLHYMDTLTGYVVQSHSLGWIKDQPATDKYAGYFASAKASLQQNSLASTRSTLQQVLQDVNVDSTARLTSEAYALIRYNTEYLLAQLPVSPAPGLNVKLVNSSGSNLTGGSLQYYDGTWKDATNNNDGTFNITTNLKTLSLRMTYEFATQAKSNVTVGPETVIFQTVNAQVKLQNSQGAPIDTGSVQYYFSSWKTLGTTTNGVASKELLPGNYTFRMTYASATNDKQQDIGANSVVLFQTVSASAQLKNSQGTLIDQGSVQYYFSSWKNFGVTTSGVATKELLPGNYTFRMTYAAATNDKQQNIGTNATVVFQTVNAAVQLKNSQGNLIDQGTVQYYFSSWNNFGSTSSGVATKELLPGNYTFRMTYAAATNDKQQNISTNATVVFQTVNAAVQLKNSQGSFIDQGTVQYYFSSWNNLGATTNGVATKELLPGNYTFRMTYESVSNDKVQNISTNGTVSFSTVLCRVSVKNSQSQPVNNALISYYSSAWKQIGPTVNGQVTKELLPANLTFRMTLGTASQDKVQNIATSSLVEFVTQ